jgi:hypothetical protein
MQARPVVGVVVGGVTDIVATNFFVMPLMVYVAATRDLSGISPEQVGIRMLAMIGESPSLQAAGWFLGLSATVLGGYVSARIARRDEVKFGALSAWLCMSLGIYGLIAQSGSAPLWQHALAFVLSPTFGAFGGYLRARQIRRRDEGGGGAAPVIVPT